MRRKFILLFAVLLTGCLAIILPYFFSLQKSDQLIIEDNHEIAQEIVAPKSDTKLPTDQNKTLKDIRGKNKLLFEGIKLLNHYFDKDQIESIKQKIQIYVHSYISNDLLVCTLMPETIEQLDNAISFELGMENVKNFKVIVTKDHENKIIDITILNSL